MGDLFLKTLTDFGFTKEQETIMLVCIMVFLGNFLGGMLTNLFRAHGGALHRRKLTDRISFRMFLVSELFVLIYALYYHIALVESVESAHIIYWISALLMAPLLAVIGSQITYLIYMKRIEANYKAGRMADKKNRAAKAARAAHAGTPAKK